MAITTGWNDAAAERRQLALDALVENWGLAQRDAEAMGIADAIEATRRGERAARELSTASTADEFLRLATAYSRLYGAALEDTNARAFVFAPPVETVPLVSTGTDVATDPQSVQLWEETARRGQQLLPNHRLSQAIDRWAEQYRAELAGPFGSLGGRPDVVSRLGKLRRFARVFLDAAEHIQLQEQERQRRQQQQGQPQGNQPRGNTGQQQQGQPQPQGQPRASSGGLGKVVLAAAVLWALLDD